MLSGLLGAGIHWTKKMSNCLVLASFGCYFAHDFTIEEQVMGTYQRHEKDARTGARVSYGTESYGANGDRLLYRGFISRGGRRWRFSALTREAVEGKVAAKLAELEREGVSAAQLSVEEKHDAARARDMLADGETLESAMRELQAVRDVLGSGRAFLDALEDVQRARAVLGGRVSLAAAADFWAVRNPAGDAVTLGSARMEYMKRLRKRNGDYFRTVDYRLSALVDALGEKTPLVSIGTADLETTLAAWKQKAEGEGRPFSDASWNAWRTTFGGFFKWAVEEYKLPANPAAGLKKREVEEREVDFLRAGDVEKLLRAAEQVAPDYVPAVAILFFAGLRPAELVGQYALDGSGVVGGLDWEDVDVDGCIWLAGRKTKNHRQRKVPISANLRAWLDAYGGEREGRIVPNPQAWKRARKAIEDAAGVAWPQDYARHSFACYRFELDGNRAALEAAMGHSPASRVLESNYKRPVRRAEAARYFKIMPTETEGE